MSQFRSWERKISRLLSFSPFMKNVVKSLYTRGIYLRSKKSYRFSSIEPLESFQIGLGASFFGYYDKSPSNSDGLVLFNITSTLDSSAKPSQGMIDLVVLDSQRNILVKVQTRTFNWQQGARAQWLTNDLFIYNDFDANKESYISRVYSVSARQEIKVFDHPVQDSYSDSFFLSLNYQRLMSLRPDYGYRNLPTLNSDQLREKENDGIWKVDFSTGETSLLVSLKDACVIGWKDEFEKANHKFNHVSISPSGKNFIFIHRYLIGKRRVDRLFLSDSTSGELKLIADKEMVSHCFWLDEDSILGYLRGPNGQDGYWIINLISGETKPFFHNKLGQYGDGHPHVHGDWVVTDTYPNKARMQTLILINWKTGDLKELGEFFHPFKFDGESRCDLHPRFSADGKSVFFDSVFSGKRQLYKIKVF